MLGLARDHRFDLKTFELVVGASAELVLERLAGGEGVIRHGPASPQAVPSIAL